MINPVISIGRDKNGEMDFQISMAIADYTREQMDELCKIIPWTIREALSLWIVHGPPSKEQPAQAQTQEQQ